MPLKVAAAKPELLTDKVAMLTLLFTVRGEVPLKRMLVTSADCPADRHRPRPRPLLVIVPALLISGSLTVMALELLSLKVRLPVPVIEFRGPHRHAPPRRLDVGRA